ncbi:armadillo-type protein [Baffinella frigidus]|nr:armadillo-type protein [Cryptophyta sp. CCMP2293]
MMWHGRMALFLALVVVARAQLVLDDIVEEHEQAPRQRGGRGADGITDPTTKLLQWSVDNMDHAAVAERAKAIREGRADPHPVDREALDAIFSSKVSYLQSCVEFLNLAIAGNDSGKLVEALEELENQVTDIDNANDLDSPGVYGLKPVMQLLDHKDPKVRTAALWVLGSATQSNIKMQEKLLDYGVLPRLSKPLVELNVLGTLKRGDPKLLGKSLYAVGSMVRGCGRCVDAFGTQGAQTLARLLSLVAKGGPEWLAVQRKTVALVGDLLREDGAEGSTVVRQIAHSFAAPAGAGAELRSGTGAGLGVGAHLVALLSTGDRELGEKVLETLLHLVGADTSSIEALHAASAQQKVQEAVNDARRHMADTNEGESWDEVAIMGEKLLVTLGNYSAPRVV